MVNNKDMSGLNLIQACNDLIVSTCVCECVFALGYHAHGCVCVCVITTRAGCFLEQNGCIIGDVHDTVLSVGVFFSACCPDSNYWGFSGEVRQAMRRRRLYRLILSTDGLFCLRHSQAAQNPWSEFGRDPGTGHINKS